MKYLPVRSVTVVEFIPGYILNNEEVLREELWEKSLRSIRTIHENGVKLPNHFNPTVEVKRVYRVLSGINLNYPEFEIEQTIDILEKTDGPARVSPDRYVSCHNDPSADNLILVEDIERYRKTDVRD